MSGDDTPAARLARCDAAGIVLELDEEGAVVLPHLFDPAQCRELAVLALANTGTALAAGVLPGWFTAWRDALMDIARPVAARWSGQARPVLAAAGALCTPLRLAQGDRLGLRQAPDGSRGDALRAVVLLSAPGRQFTGGEFVLTEQRPRMQSRPMVVPLEQGDVALIAGGARPVQGARGVYRAVMKHGVSPVRSGTRLSLDVALA